MRHNSMKKTLFPAMGLLASLLSAQAQFFTNGNLAVVRISGFDTTSSTGAAVFIDQYTTGGQLASSFAVPTSGSSALILNGEPYEGLLNLTPDGTHLVFAGYNTDLPYTKNIISSASALVPRVAATLDAYGNFLIAASTVTNFNDSVVTSAASDGTNFWMCGTGPTGGLNEIAYLGNLTAPSTNQVVTGLFTTGAREVALFDVAGTYELFGFGFAISSLNTAGGYLLSNISGALPTNSTGFTNTFPSGGPNNGFDLAINPSGTIAYLADNDIGIVKFTNNGSGWVSNYTIALTNLGNTSAKGSAATSVTADWSQNPPVLYATSGEAITNRLVTFQDTNADGVDAVTTLAQGAFTSTTNTFRGVRFVPGAYPVITSQPQSATNDAGQTITFSVSALGSSPLTYQWYSNSSVAIAGATDSSYSLVNSDTNESGTQFYVVVSNPFGTVQSSNATATVNPPGPPINVQVTPSSQTVNAGSTATFTATFVGVSNNAVTYGWTLNGTPLSDGPFGGSTISGSSTATLTISDAFATNDGDYEVFITNSFGPGSGGPGVLQVNDPAIVTNVMGVTNIPNSGPVNLSVSADGTGLTYQWLLDGTPINGANSSSYTVPNSATITSGSYSVVVTSSDGVSVTNGPTVVSFTPLILDDTFTYPDGNLFGDAGSPWSEIGGSSPIPVINDRAQIAGSNATANTAFGQSLFTQPQSNTVVWASFTINVTQLPESSSGTYFAHFDENSNFEFFGRIVLLTSNSPTYTPDIPAAAYPGTYRLGIANKASTASAVVELDLAQGIDYHVVAYYDMVNNYSGMAINPDQSDYSQVYSVSVPSTVASGIAQDTFSPPTDPLAAFGLREANNVGTLYMDDLEVSYDWSTNGSGFAAVTANMVPELPVIGLQPTGITNFVGNTGIMEVAASGIDVSYQWYQGTVSSTNVLSDTTNFQGSASNALVFGYLDATNAGSYFVVVSNVAGAVTSAVAVVSLDTNNTAPIFTEEPSNIVTSLGSTVTFTSEAVGTGPITYQWSTGDTGPNLTLARVTTNMSGNTYSVVATGGTGLSTTSSVVTLTVNGPVITNIAYLRSLQDASLAPTITVPASNSVTVYQVTGVVTEHTNIESATYAEYWIQDSTAGIEFFVEDPTFRPHFGDVVSVSGIVDIFDDALEIDGSAGNASEPYFIVSTNGESLPLPYPLELIPFGFSQANPALSSLVYQGSRGVFTNCYFEQAGQTFQSGATYVVTNNSGQSYSLYTGGSDGPDLIGQTIPSFAYSITGPYDQFDTTYEIMITAGSDIVTAPPPSVTNLTAAVTSNNLTLSWTAVPGSYTYSVESSTNLAGPWSNLQGGLWFSNSTGTYTAAVDTNIPAMFFQIASP
jgi:Immunoglobulin I-set domain